MPRYIYKCHACKESFEVHHGMYFVQEECIICKRKGDITKVPAFTLKKKIKNSPGKTGNIVNNFIKDAQSDLKNQKREAKEDIYKS